MSSKGDYLFWISVAHFVPQVGFFASTFLGSILLFLNNIGCQKIFGSYKHLINSFTTLGMVFATVEILVLPNVHNYNAGFLFFSFENSLWLDGPRIRNIPLAGYTFFHSATITLLSVLFIYRYWAIFDTQKLRLFKGNKSLLWFAYCSFFGFQYALGTYFFLELDEISSEYFREEVLIRYNRNISSLPAMSIVAYDPVDGSVRWWNIMGILNICSIVNFQYGVMIYCGYTMHTRMEDRIKHFSENMKKHHKQFFKSLVLQITAPTIVLFIPITIIIFLPLFNFNVSFPSGVMLCSFTLYPAMDSAILMYVVSEYQKTAIKIIRVIQEILQEMKRSNTTASIVPSDRTKPVVFASG